MAGTSGAVASTIAEAAALLEAADVDGVDLCLDTCHLFAAGYALDTAEGVETLFAELKTEGITDRVALIHANDSLYPRDERRDRHENIGDGFIGPGRVAGDHRAPRDRRPPADPRDSGRGRPPSGGHRLPALAGGELGRDGYGSSSARGPSW